MGSLLSKVGVLCNMMSRNRITPLLSKRAISLPLFWTDFKNTEHQKMRNTDLLEVPVLGSHLLSAH